MSNKKNANVLQYIRRQEYRRRLEEHEVWGHVGGRLYTLLKWLYFIDWAYIITFALGFIMWSYLRIDDILSFGFQYDAEEFIWHKNRMYFISILVVAAVAALVLFLIRKHLAFLITNSIVSVFFSVAFQSQDNVGKYVLFNLIPLLLLCAIGVCVYVIYFRDMKRENFEYNKLISYLYAQATKNNENYTEDQWQEYLDSIEFDYKTDILPDKPLKRSEKSRLKKAAAKSDFEEEADDE